MCVSLVVPNIGLACRTCAKQPTGWTAQGAGLRSSTVDVLPFEFTAVRGRAKVGYFTYAGPIDISGYNCHLKFVKIRIGFLHDDTLPAPDRQAAVRPITDDNVLECQADHRA